VEKNVKKKKQESKPLGWASYKFKMTTSTPPPKMDVEKRIYVVVAATVNGWNHDGKVLKVDQPWGRQVAQCAHVVSKMRWNEAVNFGYTTTDAPFKSITTIVLQARDSRELQHVSDLLRNSNVVVTDFFDTNPDYGTSGFEPFMSVKTAICTEPVEKFKTVGVLDYLPLWGSQ
jgi:hypothetical protein